MNEDRTCSTCVAMLKIKVQKLSPQPGDLLVFKVPNDALHNEHLREDLPQTCMQLVEAMGLTGKVTIVLVPDCYSIEAIQNVAAEQEREACARVVLGDEGRDDFPWCGDVRDIAAAIRARSNP